MADHVVAASGNVTDMKTPKTPPQELIEARPALADDPDVHHPSMGVQLGRPPRNYTQAVHDRICEELRKGQRAQGACARAGITVSTFHEWIRRGKSGDPHLYQFAEDVEIAFNEAEAKAVDVIAAGALAEPGSDAMSAEEAKWYLERTRADGYSKQVKTLVDTQQREFMERLERSLMGMPARMMSGPQIFELVLSIYAGQGPAETFGQQVEVTLLPEHAESD
jgi:hypothetical protein